MSGSLYRALVVDDEPPIRSLIMRALEQLHIACTPASDGKEADQLLQKPFSPQVLTATIREILDQTVPCLLN